MFGRVFDNYFLFVGDGGSGGIVCCIVWRRVNIFGGFCRKSDFLGVWWIGISFVGFIV